MEPQRSPLTHGRSPAPTSQAGAPQTSRPGSPAQPPSPSLCPSSPAAGRRAGNTAGASVVAAQQPWVVTTPLESQGASSPRGPSPRGPGVPLSGQEAPKALGSQPQPSRRVGRECRTGQGRLGTCHPTAAGNQAHVGVGATGPAQLASAPVGGGSPAGEIAPPAWVGAAAGTAPRAPVGAGGTGWGPGQPGGLGCSNSPRARRAQMASPDREAPGCAGSTGFSRAAVLPSTGPAEDGVHHVPDGASRARRQLVLGHLAHSRGLRPPPSCGGLAGSRVTLSFPPASLQPLEATATQAQLGPLPSSPAASS